MAAEKAPAFQFYPKDFLADSKVRAMNLPTLGAYVLLLCACWLDGSVPVDMDELAGLCHVPTTTFAKLWPRLAPCFVEQDGRLVQPRIERERQKQAEYRDTKVAAGRMGGRAKAEAKQNKALVISATSKTEANDSSSSSICILPSSDCSQVPAEPPRLVVNARSKRPIFTGQRLTVFEWMLDDCIKTLGNYANSFNLDEWFYSLDAAAANAGLVIPQRDNGAWLQSQLLQEARRRGLPFAVSAPAPTVGKNTARISQMLSDIQAEVS